jgi:hypothetical protein
MSCKGINKPTAEDRSKYDFLVFRGSNMEIVQGTKTKTEFNLSDFFLQADSYLTQEFTIKANERADLGPGNVPKINGEVQLIAFLVEYPENTKPEDQYIFWRYPTSTPPTSPEQTNSIGRLMILSGSSIDNLGWDLSSSTSPFLGGIVLINPHAEMDVEVRVLIVK